MKYLNRCKNYKTLTMQKRFVCMLHYAVIDLLDRLAHCTILLDYDITMDKTKEKCSVEFVVNPMVDMIHTTIKRDNFVEGSENLSDAIINTVTGQWSCRVYMVKRLTMKYF